MRNLDISFNPFNFEIHISFSTLGGKTEMIISNVEKEDLIKLAVMFRKAVSEFPRDFSPYPIG
jgi:hypothetical protein